MITELLVFVRLRRCALATLLLLIAVQPVLALDLSAELQAGVGLSDNIELAPDDEAQSDGILRLAPAIAVVHESKRIEFTLDASLEALFYRDDSDRDQANTEVASDLLFDLIDETLGWRGRASQSQVNIDPDEPVTNTNIFDTGNRDDQFVWETGPEITQDLFGNSQLRAFGYVGQFQFGDSELQDVDTQIASIAVGADPQSVGKFGYELSYLFQRLDYDDTGDVEDQNALLRIGFQYNPSLQVFGLAGLDNDLEDAGSSSLDEFRWETGFATEFASNRIEAAVGERYFGTTLRFEWENIGDSQRYRVTYEETPSNSDFLTVRSLESPSPDDPLSPPDSTSGCPGVDDRFILERFDAGAFFDLFKSQLALEAFWENRSRNAENRLDDPDTVTEVGDEEEWGVSVSFGWQVGSKTTLGLTGSFRNREEERFDDTGASIGDSDDDLYSISGDITYALGQKTDLNLVVLYEERDFGGDSLRDYDQLGGLLQVVRRFGERQ